MSRVKEVRPPAVATSASSLRSRSFWGGRKNHYRQAMRVLWKSWQYAYVGRKLRKRDFRRLWITRINAACRLNGTSYSRLIASLEEVRHRARPQGAVRHGDQRLGGLQESGRPGHRGRLRPVVEAISSRACTASSCAPRTSSEGAKTEHDLRALARGGAR